MTTADLQPGPELDRLIAERVMEWEYGQTGTDYSGYYKPGHPPLKEPMRHGHFSPSTNIAHAWEAAEKLKELGVLLLVFPHREAWAVGILEREPCHPDHFLDDSLNGIVYGKVPHAICLAALKAVQS
jgi:hypothetical protein